MFCIFTFGIWSGLLVLKFTAAVGFSHGLIPDASRRPPPGCVSFGGYPGKSVSLGPYWGDELCWSYVGPSSPVAGPGPARADAADAKL